MTYQQVNKKTAMVSLTTSHIAHKCNQLNHVALPISLLRFKNIIFYYNSPKLSYFCKKNAKFSSAGGSAPRPPRLGRLGALPPDTQSPEAGAFAPRPPKLAPHCEFLATRLNRYLVCVLHMV